MVHSERSMHQADRDASVMIISGLSRPAAPSTPRPLHTIGVRSDKARPSVTLPIHYKQITTAHKQPPQTRRPNVDLLPQPAL